METTLSEKLIESIKLTPQEYTLMECLFSDSPLTKETVSILTDGLVVDDANSNYLLMLGHLGQTKGWDFFPDDMIPRLRGILHFYQAKNAIGIPGLLSVASLFEANGVPVMLIKGIAMRTYYAPSTPRLMSDMDILVPEDRFLEAIDILADHGYVIPDNRPPHSAHVENGYASLDLHKWMFKSHNDYKTGLWERAIPILYKGVRFFVPSPADMFVHQLDNQSRNVIIQEGLHRRIKWVYDCRRIIETSESFDWELVAKAVEEFRCADRVRMMLQIFAEYFPDQVPADLFTDYLTATPETESLIKAGIKFNEAMGRYVETKKEGFSIKTPLRFLSYSRAEYLYLKPELREIDPNMNFVGFLGWKWGLDSGESVYKAAWQKFLKKAKGE